MVKKLFIVIYFFILFNLNNIICANKNIIKPHNVINFNTLLNNKIDNTWKIYLSKKEININEFEQINKKLNNTSTNWKILNIKYINDGSLFIILCKLSYLAIIDLTKKNLILFEEKGHSTCADINSLGTTIIYAGWDEKIKIIDFKKATGKEWKSTNPATSHLIISPDDKKFITFSEDDSNPISVNLENFNCLTLCNNPYNNITYATWYLNSQKIFLISENNEFSIYDSIEKKQSFKISGINSKLDYATFGSSNKILAGGYLKEPIHFWSINTDEKTQKKESVPTISFKKLDKFIPKFDIGVSHIKFGLNDKKFAVALHDGTVLEYILNF